MSKAGSVVVICGGVIHVSGYLHLRSTQILDADIILCDGATLHLDARSSIRWSQIQIPNDERPAYHSDGTGIIVTDSDDNSVTGCTITVAS